VALQQAHATSILRQVVIVGEGSSKLGVLFSAPPLSFLDMLLVRGNQVNDFFPHLLLAHLVEGFYFLTWMCVLSFCSLFRPSVGALSY
jgi:hypothetical protein